MKTAKITKEIFNYVLIYQKNLIDFYRSINL
jgi:hypothetical protein